eukprot:CAMPEP_0117804558 /NCGR_PEP_ID=MMETSP0948-20121206/17239_1 /TAXON_ID=44440 /ORGANISM="Chattonella subsalsa, Strain CCMP2191" /LENGTH=375 /DNA_ID=CAMNT_0005638255 /DNA_START=14 /DNA_END=1141 /DNA_ORIENTATION=+
MSKFLSFFTSLFTTNEDTEGGASQKQSESMDSAPISEDELQRIPTHTRRLIGTPKKSFVGKVVNRDRNANVESIFYVIDHEDKLAEYASSVEGKKMHPNEDRYIVCSSLKQYFVSSHSAVSVSDALNRARFYAVIDGHGGSLCADYLVENFSEKIVENWSLSGNPEKINDELCNILEKSLVELDADFLQLAKRKQNFSGACVVAALYLDGWLCVSNVGDSEAVLLDHRGRTIKMSKKHSHRDREEMSRIKRAGGIVEKGYIMNRIQPSRVMGDFDVKVLCEGVICDPDTYFVQLKKLPEGDAPFLVLGSDGVFDIGKRTVVGFLNKHVKFWRKCKSRGNLDKYFNAGYFDPAQALVDYARERGSKDDITAIFAEF